MAGSIINQNGSSSITVTNLIEILEGERVGFNAVSLTNMSTTSVSAIAAGSHCEIGGSLYQFSTEEPISTSNITSTAAMFYSISLVASSSEVTSHFSSLSPTWRDDYYGWYESTTSVNRVVARNYFNGSNYSTEYKHYLDEPARKNYVQDIYVSSKITCDDISPNTITCYPTDIASFYVSTGRFSTSSGFEYLGLPSSGNPLNVHVLSINVSQTASSSAYWKCININNEYAMGSTGAFTLSVAPNSSDGLYFIYNVTDYGNWYYRIMYCITD